MDANAPVIRVDVAPDGDIFIQIPLPDGQLYHIVKIAPADAMSMGTHLIACSETGIAIKAMPMLASAVCVGTA